MVVVSYAYIVEEGLDMQEKLDENGSITIELCNGSFEIPREMIKNVKVVKEKRSGHKYTPSVVEPYVTDSSFRTPSCTAIDRISRVHLIQDKNCTFEFTLKTKCLLVNGCGFDNSSVITSETTFACRSFGIGRILYALLEHAYWVRPEEANDNKKEAVPEPEKASKKSKKKKNKKKEKRNAVSGQ